MSRQSRIDEFLLPRPNNNNNNYNNHDEPSMPMTMTTTTTGTMADSMIDLDLQQLGVSSAAAIDVERNVIHDVCLLLGHVSSLSLT